MSPLTPRPSPLAPPVTAAPPLAPHPSPLAPPPRHTAPHELNLRAHPELQKNPLRALYDQVGFARSLLAYELPDGRLKLLDGHLRRDLDPDMEVDVEILDVTAQ